MAEVVLTYEKFLQILDWKLDDFCQDDLCKELDEDMYWEHVDIISDDAFEMAEEHVGVEVDKFEEVIE